MTPTELIAKLVATVKDDDYLNVGFKIKRRKRKSRGGDNTVMCSFIEPDGETVAWPTATAPLTKGDIFGNFDEWIDIKLHAAVTPTRGDGCLYQAGWFVLIADRDHVYTVEVHYWERTADEEASYLARKTKSAT